MPQCASKYLFVQSILCNVVLLFLLRATTTMKSVLLLLSIVCANILLAQTGTVTTISQRVQAIPDERLAPFYHGVASGDPLTDRVIIWTRVTTNQESVPVHWRVATDTALTNVVAQGDATANANHDYCVKVDVTGLQPNTTYYYGFTALQAHSLTGRTRTLPTGDYPHARLGVVSCSNYQSGYFNVYARLAERNDLDMILHLGDYIYEYGADTTGDNNWVVKNNRIPQPNKELLTLGDYRTRYASYRLDEDARRVHQQHPFVCVWDDHEFANDAWRDGAQNHQTGEGDWATRVGLAKRAYFEWIPIRDNTDSAVYRSFSVGTLADVFMIDSRMSGRDKQVYNTGANASQASKDSLSNPNRTMLGKPQYTWLTEGLKKSTAQWKIIGNQVMFTPTITTPVDTNGMSANTKFLLPLAEPLLQERFSADSWGNYPAEQMGIMNTLKTNNIQNAIITTGDFHCSFAFNVTDSPKTYNGTGAVAVEFLVPSVTADNFDEYLYNPDVPDNLKQFKEIIKQAAPELLRSMYSTLQKNNPNLEWVDLEHNGYYILDVNNQRTQADWFFVDTVLLHTTKEQFIRGYFTNNNQNKLQRAAQPAPLKEKQEIPAPLLPPQFVVSVADANQQPNTNIVVLSCYPNPATTTQNIQYALRTTSVVRASLCDNTGRTVQHLFTGAQQPGIYQLRCTVQSLPSGTYFYTITNGTTTVTQPIVIER